MNTPPLDALPRNTSGHPQRYRVCVSDAFMDADDATEADSYATFDEALVAAERMVRRELLHLYAPGFSAERWMEDYMDFGDDPWIRPSPEKENGRPIFSAWEYAEAMTKRWITEGIPRSP